MSQRYTEDIADKLEEFSKKLFYCENGLKEMMNSQTSKCPCSSESLEKWYGEIGNCKTILTTMKPLWMPLVDCVEGLLSKAQRLIEDCKPKECDKTCVKSCAKVREATFTCLELSDECVFKPKFWRALKELLKEVHSSPRIAMCRCYTHLNTETLCVYLQMVHSVIVCLIKPLSTKGNSSPQETKDKLLQEGSIHMAAIQRSVPQALLAIQNGKRVDSKTQYKFTALHIATILKDLDMVKLLLDKSADPYMQDVYEFSPLLLATITQQKAMVELMSCKEWKTKQSSVQFFRSIIMALSLQDKDILEILVSKHTALNEYVNSIRLDEESEFVDQSENTNDIPEHRPGTSGGNENGSNCIFVNEKKRHGGSEAEERTGGGDGTIVDKTADLLKPLTFRE